MNYVNADLKLITFDNEDVLATSTHGDDSIVITTTRCFGSGPSTLPEEEL